jgi:hypothetical protein
MAGFLWSQRQNMGPAARCGHAMAYDGSRERTLLFGGETSDSTLLNDTWDWDGTLWRQMEDTGPAPRTGHQMCFDAARELVVLFGGRSDADVLRRDTWIWDGRGWTQVEDTGPAARTGHQLAYDRARKYVVVFGGEAAGGILLGDTWIWDGNGWTQVEDTGPTAREGHAMAFDLHNKRVMLFGGQVGSTTAGDTWSWDGQGWTQVADTGPAPCVEARMASTADGLILYGGRIGGTTTATGDLSAQQAFGLTWEWRDGRWTQRQDIGPGPRWGHNMVLDVGQMAIVLFGGVAIIPSSTNNSPIFANDTWHFPVTGRVTDDTELSVTVEPTTVDEGGVIVVAADISEPPTALLYIDLMIGDQEWRVGFQANETSLEYVFPLMFQFPVGDLEITAQLGDQKVFRTIQVVEGIDLNITSFTLTPNPITAGEMLTLEVTIDKVAPAGAVVKLGVEGTPLPSIVIQAGDNSGKQQLPVPAEAASGTHLFEAVVGNTAATATLTVT